MRKQFFTVYNFAKSYSVIKMASKSDKPFKITENNIYGRYLIATRDIYPSEKIIDELPVVTGPMNLYDSDSDTDQSDQLCLLVCCTCVKLKDNVHTCKKCGLKLCSSKCAKDPIHAKRECVVFKSIRKSQPDLNFLNNKSLCNFILTIRCLFYLKEEPECNKIAWSKIDTLQSKVQELEKVGAFADIEALFSLLKWEHFGFDRSDDIMKLAKHCLGAMRTNAFSTLGPKHGREGLYFLSSFMPHTCLTSTDRKIQARTGRMVTRAARLIKKDEPIPTTYLPIFLGTNERWKETRRIWFFTCKCERCINPELELVINLSTIKCPLCSEMTLSPSVCPATEKLVWRCRSEECHYAFMQESYDETDENGYSPWYSIDQVEDEKPVCLNWKNLEETEQWLEKFSGQELHKNHYLFTQVKLYLCQYYGRELENGIVALEGARLRRKISYCEAVLEVFDKLFQGSYQVQGIALFELWVSLCEVCRRNEDLNHTDFGDIDVTDARLERVRQEALSILKYAFPKSAEEEMFKILRDHDNGD